MVWVYDRNKDEYRFQPTTTTAGDKAFYTFTLKDGTKIDGIEKMFTQIEGNAAKVIKEICCEKKNLNMQEKSDLAMFITALYIRTPEFIENTKKSISMMTKYMMSFIHTNKEYHDKVWAEMERTGKIPKGSKNKEKVRQDFIKKNYDIVVPKEYSLQIMVKSLLDLYKYIVQMEWKVLIAPKRKAYLTSDKPAYTINANPTPDFYGSNLGLFALNCETFCILTPQIAIYLSQKHGPEVAEIYEAKEEFIDFLNQANTITCYRFLVSHAQPLIKKWVDKTQLKNRGLYHQVSVN